MVKPKYETGKEALKSFEKTMAALFQVKKSELEKKPKPERKEKEDSKD